MNQRSQKDKKAQNQKAQTPNQERVKLKLIQSNQKNNLNQIEKEINSFSLQQISPNASKHNFTSNIPIDEDASLSPSKKVSTEKNTQKPIIRMGPKNTYVMKNSDNDELVKVVDSDEFKNLPDLGDRDLVVIKKTKLKDVTTISFEKKARNSEIDTNLSNERALEQTSESKVERVAFVEPDTIQKDGKVDLTSDARQDEDETSSNKNKNIIIQEIERSSTDIKDAKDYIGLLSKDDSSEELLEKKLNENYDVVSEEHLVDLDKKEERIQIISKKGKTKFFYEVKDHQELYKVGNSYYRDFENGIKHFAIASSGLPLAQQKTVLGLASYFEHKEALRIAIFSTNLRGGFLKETIDQSVLNSMSFNETSLPYYHYQDNFHFIEIMDLAKIINKYKFSDEYDAILSELMNSYDLVFWDVPEVEEMKQKNDLYFPLSLYFQNVTIIVKRSKTKIKELIKIKTFFEKYGIPIKGILYESS